jgi:hypothetical protein
VNSANGTNQIKTHHHFTPFSNCPTPKWAPIRSTTVPCRYRLPPFPSSQLSFSPNYPQVWKGLQNGSNRLPHRKWSSAEFSGSPGLVTGKRKRSGRGRRRGPRCFAGIILIVSTNSYHLWATSFWAAAIDFADKLEVASSEPTLAVKARYRIRLSSTRNDRILSWVNPGRLWYHSLLSRMHACTRFMLDLIRIISV